MPDFTNIIERLRRRDQRGAALVEFAVAIPIFLGLIAIIFDAGQGYTAARASSSAARSAARVGALAGDDPLADYRALDALRTQFGDGSTVESIYIYISDPTLNTSGAPPTNCPVPGSGIGTTPETKCTKYPGSILDTLDPAQFAAINVNSPTETCPAGAQDTNWCPSGRAADRGSYLAVQVTSTKQKTIGLWSSGPYELEDRAVFALYFAPPPVAGTPTPTPTN